MPPPKAAFRKPPRKKKSRSLKQRTTVSVPKATPKFDDPVTTSLQQPAPSIATDMLQNSDKLHSIRKSQRERKAANFFVVVEPQANKNDDSSEGIEDEADAMLLSEQELGATNKNTSSRDANIPDSNRRSQRERKQTDFLTVGKEARPSYRDDPQLTEDDRSDTISSLEASSQSSATPFILHAAVDQSTGRAGIAAMTPIQRKATTCTLQHGQNYRQLLRP